MAVITDPDPGGPKTYGSGSDPVHWLTTGSTYIEHTLTSLLMVNASCDCNASNVSKHFLLPTWLQLIIVLDPYCTSNLLAGYDSSYPYCRLWPFIPDSLRILAVAYSGISYPSFLCFYTGIFCL